MTFHQWYVGTALIANAQQTTAASKNVVRDSAIILLEGKSIPARSFIHLYDATPYMITNGHIVHDSNE